MTIPAKLTKVPLPYTVDDWPLGFQQTCECRFDIERKTTGRGEPRARIVRQTMTADGKIHAPKRTIWTTDAALAVCDAGRTYVLLWHGTTDAIEVQPGTLKWSEYVWPQSSRYAELRAMIG